MKKIILLLAMGAALTTQTLFAQVPSYVPTNGLVGYWPFNGNANDVSGNGNNGTVNGATITTDRNGNVNSAYSFNGTSNFIEVQDNNLLDVSNNFTISLWMKISDYAVALSSDPQSTVLSKPRQLGFATGYAISAYYNLNLNKFSFSYNIGTSGGGQTSNAATPLNTWINVIYTYDGSTSKLYKNGVLESSSMISYVLPNFSTSLFFGKEFDNTSTSKRYFKGLIDDVGIWNRALTQQEITNLFNSISSNECLTMIINTGVLSTNPVTYTSTVNIYPNPANDQITIDCGNLANVVGWNIKITNMLGQEVFNQPMNTQQYVVPLNSWTGQGMYFVKIINSQNEVVNIKKIILQ